MNTALKNRQIIDDTYGIPGLEFIAAFPAKWSDASERWY